MWEKDWGWLAVVDWLAVKTEYVTTAIGYRELSKKHRIRYKTLADRAKAEGWVEARHQYREKAITAAEDAMAAKHAVRAVKFQSVADRLLEKIEAMVDAEDAGDMTPKDIRALTAAMGDLKDIMDIRSKADTREQEARIANLERQARADVEKDQEVTVRLTGGLEDYAQ